MIGRAEAGVSASPMDFGALGSRQPGTCEPIDSDSQQPKSTKEHNQGQDLIPTDLPIADMGAR